MKEAILKLHRAMAVLYCCMVAKHRFLKIQKLYTNSSRGRTALRTEQESFGLPYKMKHTE